VGVLATTLHLRARRWASTPTLRIILRRGCWRAGLVGVDGLSGLNRDRFGAHAFEFILPAFGMPPRIRMYFSI